jgi:hypothetical protein
MAARAPPPSPPPPPPPPPPIDAEEPRGNARFRRPSTARSARRARRSCSWVRLDAGLYTVPPTSTMRSALTGIADAPRTWFATCIGMLFRERSRSSNLGNGRRGGGKARRPERAPAISTTERFIQVVGRDLRRDCGTAFVARSAATRAIQQAGGLEEGGLHSSSSASPPPLPIPRAGTASAVETKAPVSEPRPEPVPPGPSARCSRPGRRAGSIVAVAKLALTSRK